MQFMYLMHLYSFAYIISNISPNVYKYYKDNIALQSYIYSISLKSYKPLKYLKD